MSGGDGYLTNALYREIAKMMTDAGIPHRVEQGAKHFHVKFEHLGVERTQILHLGPNNKGSTRRKTIIRFRKIVEAERAFRDQQTSPELELERPAMSEQEKPAAEAPSPSFDLALHVVDDEPRVLDTDVGKRLGYTRPYKIRELIERNTEELRRYGPLPLRRGQSRGQEFDAFYLNEPQAVLLCLRSDAPSAPDAREVVINTFMAVRRGQIAPAVATIDSASMKATAQLAGSSAGGAAKNAIVSVRNRIDGLDDRLTDQAKWMQAANRDMHAKMDRLMILIDGASAVALQALDMIEVGSVYEIAGVLGPIRSRTILTTNIKRGLDEWCIDHSIPMHNARVSGRRIRHWPKAAVADWLAAEGHALIARHLRTTAPSAQLLPFTKPSEGGA